ncbi:hypothetical protein ACMFMG_011949 [Clarireedia jacksonii]
MQFSAAFIIAMIPLVLALPAVVTCEEGDLAEDAAAATVDAELAREEKIVAPLVHPLMKPAEKLIDKEVKKIEKEIGGLFGGH